MPLHAQLLEVLVCPVTKLPVTMLAQEKLQKLNKLIAEGTIQTIDGQAIAKPLEQALITKNKNIIYRIENNIPIMLEHQGIAASQLERG